MPLLSRAPSWALSAIFLLTGIIGACSWASRGGATSPRAEPLMEPEDVRRIASYRLQARLDEEKHTVEGRGTITFTNPSRKPTRELYFHLYLNAFENHETLFQRGKGSRSGRRKGAPGSVVVHSLRSAAYGGKNLWKKASKHSPGDPKDRTDIRVPLPRPLQGGETVELDIEFTSNLPEVVERTGYEGDFHLVAQWFPKLAKLEKNGKWAHFAFHPHSEFYADFGDYEITIDVPADYVFGSTGEITELDTAPPGRKLYRARAEAVHDFAWTAWPDFVDEERDIEGTRVRLLRPPYTDRVAERTWTTLERGLPSLGAAYGPYPFSQLTVVQPPAAAGRAGGMEYPQFITTGGSEPFTFLGVRDVELLTIHELGHQWFQGLLASNENAYPFLDEGLTSYLEGRYLKEQYGPGSLVDLSWLKVARYAGARHIGVKHPGETPIAGAAPEFEGFSAYGALVYARTSVALETLGRVYSFPKLHDALRYYAHKHRFGHPKPKDFFRALQERMGNDAREQAERIFLKRGTIDYQITDVDLVAKNGALESKTRWESSVHWKRVGTLDFPTILLAQFADGTHQVQPIQGKSGTATFTHSAQVISAHMDPGRSILLDTNLENNLHFVAPHGPLRSQQFHSGVALVSFALAVLSP